MNKAGNQCWIYVIFRPLGSAALKMATILSWEAHRIKQTKVCMYGDMYIYCLWIYSLHIWKDTIGTQFFKHSSPLIFQQDNTELYTASSTTAWLFSRRVGSKLASLQSRPFTSWTRLKRQETKSMWKISQNCWNSQNGTTLLSTPASWCPQFPGVYGLFWETPICFETRCCFCTAEKLNSSAVKLTRTKLNLFGCLLWLILAVTHMLVWWSLQIYRFSVTFNICHCYFSSVSIPALSYFTKGW